VKLNKQTVDQKIKQNNHTLYDKQINRMIWICQQMKFEMIRMSHTAVFHFVAADKMEVAMLAMGLIVIGLIQLDIF